MNTLTTSTADRRLAPVAGYANEPLEIILQNLCSLGVPSLHKMQKGWWVTLKMHVAAAGTEFTVKSEYLLAGGASITQVQELLGHNSVETTQVYLHCIPQFAQTITSPLDALPQVANVVPFESDAAGRSARAPVGRRAA